MSLALYPVGVESGVPYAIVGPDGSRAVLNDVNDPDYVGYVNPDGVTGLERAGVRASADLLPEADGMVAGVNRYEGLAFTLQGFIPPDGPSGADTWLGRQHRLLAATDAMRADAYLYWTPSTAAIGRDPFPLRLRFRQAQPTRLTGRRPKTFIVAGQAERNVVEAANATLVRITPDQTAAFGGMQSPLVSPLASNAAPSSAATVVNYGRSTAWPLITIYGPCTNPSISNVTLGRTLAFTYPLGAGESLVIDTDPSRRTIRLNGVTNRYSALNFPGSVWWGLIGGAIDGGINDVRLGFATYSAGAAAELLYRHAWG